MASVHGASLDIPTPYGVADAYLAHPDDGKPHPGVLLYMDAFGLRPSLEELAGRLAGHGYTVLVPNVLYRAGRAPVVDRPGGRWEPEGPRSPPTAPTALRSGPCSPAVSPTRALRPVWRPTSPDLRLRDVRLSTGGAPHPVLA